VEEVVMLDSFKLNEESSLYEYCKRLVLLYEMEANLFSIGCNMTEELRDCIVEEILDVEEELRDKIISRKL